MNKHIISFALVGLMLVSFVKTDCAITFKKAAVVTSALVAGLAIYRLNAKKAAQEPASRFETEKLKTAISNKEFKEAANQIWYFIDDIIIGQLRKSDGVVADKEGKLEVKKGNPCSGVMGNIESKLNPISKALAAVVAVVAFYNFDTIIKKYNNFTNLVDSACE